MHTLVNKTAIIVGASSGIGRAAAKLFAEAGAQVVVGGAAPDGARGPCRGYRASGRRNVSLPGGRCPGRSLCQSIGGIGGHAFRWSRYCLQQCRHAWRDGADAGPVHRPMARNARHQSHQRLSCREISNPRNARSRRRLAHFHLDIRRLYGRHAWHGGLCGEQVRTYRPDAGAGCGVRIAGRSRKRASAGRHRYAYGPHRRQYAGGSGAMSPICMR